MLGDSFDLGSLHLKSGQAHRVELDVPLDPVALGGQGYTVPGDRIPAILDCSRTAHGWALRLRFKTELGGPCMRCLEAASPAVEVDTREIEQPGETEDLHSPYVSDDDLLDLRSWTRDALVLALPDKIVCRDDCKGLCPVCGENLNTADAAEHRHETSGDPRWAKLKEIRFQ